MTNEELQQQINKTNQEIETLKQLFYKNNYSKLQVFEKDVIFKGDVSSPNKSRARAYLATSTQSIPDITATKVLFNAESFDILGEFASYKFTATKAGYYLIHSTVLWQTPVDGSLYEIFIYKNNAVDYFG